MPSTRLSERVAVLATVDPDAYSTGTQTSDWALMENWGRALAIINAGIIAASGTLDAKLMQATSSTGAGAVTIAGKAITQMTTGDNDKQAMIDLKADELNVAGGFTYVALRMTLATAGGDVGGVLLGGDPRYGPASDHDLASVDEIIS